VVAGRRFLAVLFSAAVLVAACGGTSTGSDDETECVALCEKGKAKGCNGASALNCEDNCLQEDARAETSGCRGTYNQTLACSSGLEDICTLIRDCREELLRHQACVDEYCSDHVADFCS
jgi:hypothetical protein